MGQINKNNSYYALSCKGREAQANKYLRKNGSIFDCYGNNEGTDNVQWDLQLTDSP